MDLDTTSYDASASTSVGSSALDALPTSSDTAQYACVEIPAGFLRALGTWASQDQTRFHLNGVLVTVVDGSAVLVATDGHRLIRATGVKLCGVRVANARNADYIVPSAQILAACKAAGAQGSVVISCSGKHGTIHAYDKAKSGAGNFAFARIDALFPPYQQVIPKTDAGIDGFAANPTYLAAMEDVVAGLDGKSRTTGVELIASGDMDPQLWTFRSVKNPSIVVDFVIMPMRRDRPATQKEGKRGKKAA